MIYNVAVDTVCNGRILIYKAFIAFRISVVGAAVTREKIIVKIIVAYANSAVESVRAIIFNYNGICQKIHCGTVAVISNVDFGGFSLTLPAYKN